MHKGAHGTVDEVGPRTTHIKYDPPGRNCGVVCGCHPDGHVYVGAFVNTNNPINVIVIEVERP